MKLPPALHGILFGLIVLSSGLIFVCLAMGVLVVGLEDPYNIRAPSDHKLLRIFHDHREAFERLSQMATEDSRRGRYFSKDTSNQYESAKLSDARRQEYRTLLSDISTGPDMRIDYDNKLRFIFASGGLSAIGPGWLKGIEYLPGDYKREGVVVQNLDKARLLAPNVYLCPIEPKWFLVYQRTDD